MTTINYGPYTPTQLKVVSLGIGISDETNNKLNILNNQSLVVGERLQDILGIPNQKTYGLIVDTQGIAINTSMTNRSQPYNNYAAYIDGDVRVTGNIFLDGTISRNISILNGTSCNNYWTIAPDGTYNNIYYGKNITIGNQNAAMSNTYSVNIYQSADTNIEQSQLSIQNLQASQLRMGVIGTAYNSPVIFNTNSFSSAGGAGGAGGGSIEFHVGRDKNYFSNVYFAADGSTTGLPNYTANNAPHFQIDYAGNVGINTSVNDPVSFNIRSVNAGNVVSFTPITTPMSLNVQGSTYSKNMLIYDYESKAMCNIDSLYVRQFGVAFEANQVKPGTFANGNDYTFPNSLNINKNVSVNGTASVNNLVANNSIIDSASFCNDTLFNRDIIVNQSLRIRGQIFTEVFNGLSSDGTSNYGFEMIQFTPAKVSYNNINVIGTGIATPGRLGVGINPAANANNPVNNQFAIYKTNPQIWEISMFDKSDTLTGTIKAGYIGHPSVSPGFRGGLDASLVIATPSYDDPYYSGNYQSLTQNIYFFPGIDMKSTAPPIVSSNVTPTLGIFNLPGNSVTKSIHAVGINTYNPLSELDVNGSITFSGNIYYNPSSSKNGNIQLAIWKTQIYNAATLTPGATSLFYTGISYIAENPNAAHVGINTTPSITYGLNISGDTRFINDVYKIDTSGIDRSIGFWQDNRNPRNILNNVAPSSQSIEGGIFTWANVGIGLITPKANLEIKDNYNVGTTLQLTKGTGSSLNSSLTSIVYQGNQPYNSWTFQADHNNKYFQIGNGDNPFNYSSNVRYMWMRPDSVTNKPRIVLGGDLNIFNDTSNPDRTALLTVGGNMSVLGNVSISGQFVINGKTLLNSNIPGSAVTSLNNDDVFIGGGNIQFSPGTDYIGQIQSVIIGTPFTTYSTVSGDVPILGNQPGIVDPDANKMFRVYNKTSGVVASFQGNGTSSLIEIVRNYGNNSTIKDVLQFGLYDPTSADFNGTTFAFMDGDKKPYLSFKSLRTINDNYVGIGVPFTQSPTAITHIYTEGTGENMLRLTRGVLESDTTDGAPQIDFQKNYQRSINNLSTIIQAPTSWTLKGPIASWYEKLSFIHNKSTAPGSFTSTSTEVFTIASNGCIGIGNSQPKFSLDIINNGNVGSLRLLNTGENAAPQVIFQSGAVTDEYGSDNLRDFRMATSNSAFTFDSKDASTHYFILDVDKYNNIGIGQAANCNFDISLNGTVNISQGIYLDGSPLFSSGNLFQNGVKINGNNIFITPNTNYPSPNGGVVINGTTPTGNLFHIHSGNNANMLVLDSSYSQAQMYMRTTNSGGIQNMYRVSMSNTSYAWQYYPNYGNSLTISDTNNEYQSVMNVQPTLRNIPNNSPAEFDFSVDGSIILNSSNNPGLYFGKPNTDSSMGSISGSNANICLMVNSLQKGIGIGTYNPQSNFHVVGTSLFDGYTTFNYNTNINANLYVYGNSYVQGNQVTGLMTANSSDRRLKKDLIKIENALDKINTLTGYTYSLINEELSDSSCTTYLDQSYHSSNKVNTTRRYTGLIAQEVESILPEAILKYTPNELAHIHKPETETNQYLSVSYGNMMGLVVEAIKELSVQIAEIKATLSNAKQR